MSGTFAGTSLLFNEFTEDYSGELRCTDTCSLGDPAAMQPVDVQCTYCGLIGGAGFSFEGTVPGQPVPDVTGVHYKRGLQQYQFEGVAAWVPPVLNFTFTRRNFSAGFGFFGIGVAKVKCKVRPKW
jgi:hypothetical protein